MAEDTSVRLTMNEDLKTRLLKPRIDEAEVEIPGMGIVRVRGLSRKEHLLAVRKGDMDAQGNPEISRVQAIECRMLALAMVDPAMTEEEVAEWQAAAPTGEIEPVSNKVQELSGNLPGAPKAAYKSVRGRSRK